MKMSTKAKTFRKHMNLLIDAVKIDKNEQANTREIKHKLCALQEFSKKAWIERKFHSWQIDFLGVPG